MASWSTIRRLVFSLESGDAWSNKTTGYVPVVQDDETIAWESASGGGGGGFTPPGPVEELDFNVGSDPAKVKLLVDANNNGSGYVGMYPADDGTTAGLTMFNNGTLPDGSSVGGSKGPYVLAASQPGGASVGTSMWNTQAGARVGIVSSTGLDDGHFYGELVISKDDAAPTDGPSPVVVGSVFAVQWDGLVVVGIPGAGIKFTSPDGLTTKTLSIDNSGDPVWT